MPKGEWRRTDKSGLLVYEQVPKGTYSIQIDDKRKPVDQIQGLSENKSRDAKVKDGMISHLIFELKRKSRLKVEVLGDKIILANAEVHAKEIVPPSNGSGQVKLEDGPKDKCVDGKVDFGRLPSRKYRVGLTIAGLKADDYEVNEVDVDLAPGEEETVTLKVELVFKKVRFIAYCLATIAKQIWTGNNTLVQDFRQTPAHQNCDDESAYVWWGKRMQAAKASWKYKYNGKRNDREDIGARIDTLKAAIAKAAAEIQTTTGDDELKVFVAPECFSWGGTEPMNSTITPA
jgi:hypothetical protein